MSVSEPSLRANLGKLWRDLGYESAPAARGPPRTKPRRQQAGLWQNLQKLWKDLGYESAPRLPDPEPYANGDVFEEDYGEDERFTKAMVLREFGRAARAWGIFYAIVFAVLLVSKWQTRAYYQAEYEQKMALYQARLEAVQNAGGGKGTKQTGWWDAHLGPLEDAIQKLGEITKEQDIAISKVTRKHRETSIIRNKLMKLDVSAKKPEAQDEERTSVEAGQNLQGLLNRSTLAEISDTTNLNAIFVQALAELGSILEDLEKEDSENIAKDWASINGQLSGPDLPTKYPSHLGYSISDDEWACPTMNSIAASAHGSKGPVVPPGAARKSQLEERVEKIEDVLKRRGTAIDSATQGSFGLVLPESGPHLQRVTRKNVQNKVEEVAESGKLLLEEQQLAKKERQRQQQQQIRGTQSCVTEEDVLDLVEDGLLALESKADLRNVLRRAVMKLDPSADTIILDAHLPAPKPRIPQKDSINLQRYLDNPGFHQLSSALDQLVDLSGGYSDEFDQWLDTVVPSGGRESVGEVVVRYLFEESSKVEVPSSKAMMSTTKSILEKYLPEAALDLLRQNDLLRI